MEDYITSIDQDKLKAFEKNHYEGYFWKSDEPEAQAISGQFDFSSLSTVANPFIVEANLVAADQSHSISLKFLDGAYHISLIEIENAKKDPQFHLVEKIYIVKGFRGNKKIKFLEAWAPEEDPLCLNHKVLRPSWTAFLGFCENTEEV